VRTRFFTEVRVYLKNMKNIILLIVTMTSFIAYAAAASKVQFTGKNIITNETLSATVDGKKALVVIFLSAKCPCSNSHIEELKSLSYDFPDFNFVGVHSNLDEAVDVSKAYFTQMKLPFPVIQDVNAAIADQYQAFKTPHAFVIHVDGQILYQGGVSSSKNFAKAEHKFLRNALLDIHLGQTVAKAEGRTLGCSIARNLK